MSERQIFALARDGIGEPMTLRTSTGRIDALDSTDALIATAHFVRGTGWVLCRDATREVLGYAHHRVEAETELRKIVGRRL